MELRPPSMALLPSYADALARGWSPDTQRAATAREQLSLIAHDAGAFLAGLDDRAPIGRLVTLPDGSRVPRIPGFTRWMAEGDDFLGAISLRWQSGTDALPPHVLGHIGYTVVPWARRRGHATRALGLLLPEARAVGLGVVTLTTDPDNAASIRVIGRNGGVLVERFLKGAQYGGTPSLRYRITL